jgi:4-amino-4-deoxy-L-arabinose transferase-like glycosyltransferase
MIEATEQRHRWILFALLVLAPLWIVGLFDRGYWTPDEPREADIAWRMSIQTDRTLPELADSLFLEKPPLTYWLSAGAMHVFGDSAAAARAPNLIYAITATLAIGFLVFSMAGTTAAATTAITAGSAFTAYQVAIWLAPDACLIAGCSVALLGLYRGYVASASRSKLYWYTLMHVGALIGFMAKSGPGWIYPTLTLLALVIWERRWKELLCWELWLGLVLQVFVIGTWVYAVWQLPGGANDLRILFWNNLAGRFADLHASGALDYASAHKNWFGKYFVELPYHLFPWTFLVAAALYRAWTSTRLGGAARRPWRFAIAACLPFLVLLSFASTARGIYIAPALLGFSILVGLWSRELASSPTRYDELAIAATRCVVAVLAVIMVTALGVMALANVHSLVNSDFIRPLGAGAAIIAIASFAIWMSLVAQREHRLYRSIIWICLAYVGGIVAVGAALFPQFDQWQNLGVLAQSIQRDANGRAIALLQPDETTIAMMDHGQFAPLAIIESNDDAPQQVIKWFAAHEDGLILVKLPGHATGPLTQLLNHIHVQKAQTEGLLATLEQAGAAHLVAHYDLQEGRRYALIGTSTASVAISHTATLVDILSPAHVRSRSVCFSCK